jgi:hypothetical protein
MPTIYQELKPEEAQYAASNFPSFIKNYGTNGPVTWLAYDASTSQNAFWDLSAFNYGGGSITLQVVWAAASATSGTVRWSASLAAITPESDSQDPETKAYGDAVTVDDTHLGSTAHRLHIATNTISGDDLDSAAEGDELWLRVGRVAGIGGNMSGAAWLRKLRIAWDT